MKIKRISEGAEAQVYSLKFLGFDTVLKKRTKKDYRLKEIDENLRLQRTKTEAKITAFASSLEINTPNILLVDKYGIYMSRINGSSLNHLLNEKLLKKNILNNLFSVIGDYTALLHNNNIVHGDYTPANIMIDDKMRVYLIDFGLSEITTSVESKALDLLLMKRAIDKDQFKKLIERYRIKCKGSKIVEKRLAQIEKRGRYNTRTLLVN